MKKAFILNYYRGIVSRYRQAFNLARLTKRYVQRKGVGFEEAKLEQIQLFKEKNQLSSEKEAEEYYHNPVFKESLPIFS